MIAALKVFFHGHQVGKVKAMRPSREDPYVRSLQFVDHSQIRDLAAELMTGMPAWRSPEGQRAAVESWIDAALTAAEEEGHAVFVAAASAPDEPSGIREYGRTHPFHRRA